MASAYFAYGSNMSPARFARRCPGARLLGRAVLDGFRLGFAGFSKRWKGGVATAVAEAGTRLEGVLWEVSGEDVSALDRQEGAGFAYAKVTATVRSEGGLVEAMAYVKPDDAAPAPPTTGYVDVLEAALHGHGLDASAVARAVEAVARIPLAAARTRIFVYGTLRRGGANARFLRKAWFLGPARTAAEYELAHLGSFPGMVAGGAHSVLGEVYDVDADLLGRLDALEGHPDFYERRPLTLLDGREAWAYLLPREAGHGRRRIAGGDWFGG